MEVTKSNFLAVLPEVEEAIESADFVSFDTEFTGLTNKSEKVFMYEETSERYRKILKNTESYMQVQFGKWFVNLWFMCYLYSVLNLCTI